MTEHFYTVEGHDTGKRLDRFLAEKNPQHSRSQIAGAIRQGLCQVGDLCQKQPDLRLKTGQEICLRLPDGQSQLVAEEGPVEICFEDQRLCVVNKPAGLTVHPCPSCPKDTLIQRLLPHFSTLASMQGLRPGIVHRLDKDTSGLLLVALDEETRLALSQLFSQHNIAKDYLALVSGACPEEGECQLPIGRDPQSRIKMAILPENKGGKTAHSQWRRLWLAPDKQTSLICVRIHTGRTHQIRVHMANLGYPLLGDKVYAPKPIAAKAPRQMLHAYKLSFCHPWSGEELHFQKAPPADFYATALNCAHLLQKVVITGNPGSGKSSLTKFFQERGFAVFSADQEIQKLYTPRGQVASWLSNHGGRDVVSVDGHIERDALFALFKANPLVKRDLEEMLHATVKAALDAFFAKQASHEVAFAEIPLFFECGWQNRPDLLSICVTCPQRERFARLAKNRGWSLDKASTIESWQWPEAKKAKACDLTVDNSADTLALKAQAENLLAKLNSLRQNDLAITRQTLTKLLGLSEHEAADARTPAA